jgi:glycerol kinase
MLEFAARMDQETTSTRRMVFDHAGSAYAAGPAVGYGKDLDHLPANRRANKEWRPQRAIDQVARMNVEAKNAVSRTLDRVEQGGILEDDEQE